MYPLILKTLFFIRRMVRDQRKASAFEEDIFRIFWEFVCPALILLIADTDASPKVESEARHRADNELVSMAATGRARDGALPLLRDSGLRDESEPLQLRGQDV